MSTLTGYLTIANNLSRYKAMTANDPLVAQATRYFQANISAIKTPKQLVSNTRIFNYVMNAFGLHDMTYAKALIQKVLEQGTSRPEALANKLNNPNILALANAFNFPLYGDLTTQTIAATSGVVGKYVMQALENDEGKQNPGVQLALYFQQNASMIRDGYSILADKNLLTVVQTALGISPYTSLENIDRQAKQFNGLLTYSDFQDPTKVRNFLERFTAQYDVVNPAVSSSGKVSAVVGAIGGTSTVSFSTDLLMAIQNLKAGG